MYTLKEYHGIGAGKIEPTDFLFSYLNLNESYLTFAMRKPCTLKTSCYMGHLFVTEKTCNGYTTQMIKGYYQDDEAAFADGVLYLQEYLLAEGNDYGLPKGMRKQQVEFS